ncbi:hypothetical protein [Streptomyces flavidovirens]|uniref:hypothetical protein n=1 Tax=Streptomyces flavidovirens TaxID=67298 RepID=UPI0036AC2646
MAHAEKVYKVRNGKQTKQFTWRVRYKKPDGTWGSEPGFPTKKTAEDWGDGQEAAIKAGRWIDPDLQRKHFGEFARTFMKARVKRGRTMDKRWDLLQTHILPKWEHAPLIGITWFDVDSWQMTLDCEDVTAGHAVSLMSTILTAAVDAKHITVNPLFGRRRTQPSAPAPKKPKKTDEEKWAPPEVVIQLAQRLGPATGMHVLTTAFTGLRWGEGAGLHRDNVLKTRRQANDGGWFECPVIKVVPDVGELSEVELRDDEGNKLGTVLRLENPKSEKGVRDIDLPPFLAQLLRYHLDDWPHSYVFCTPSGKFWRRGNWGKVLRPAADGRPEREKRQGVSPRPAWEPIMPGLDMRALRHTHDTYQDQIGVRPSLAHEQAGHKMSGIKGVYQHPTPTMRQERLDGLEEIFWRGMRNLGLKTLWNRVDLRKIPQTINDDLANAA